MNLHVTLTNRVISATVLTAAHIGTIAAANWAVVTFGNIPVGFGLEAPAGVLAIGLAFTLRDLLHRAAGWRVVVAAIFVGTAVSYFVAGPKVAFAAGAAFLVSELADLGVFAPLLRRGWLLAVAASNAVGLVVDSVLFLWLAFGSMAFLPGQIIGKAAMTLLALGLLRLGRRRVEAWQALLAAA